MTDRSDRRCVRCNREPGYNRAVLDLVRGVEIGSLCRNCELGVFYVLDTSPVTTSGEGHTCACCDRDGFYALPRWLPETCADTGTVRTSVDYQLDDQPLFLCDEHFDELTGTAATVTSGVSSPGDGR